MLVDKTSQGPEEDSITIERCKIGRFSGDGLNLKFIWCITLSGNMICYNEGSGVRLSGYHALISDNWISGNGLSVFGAYEWSPAISITGNRIEWNGARGPSACIYLKHSSHYNICSHYIDRSSGPAIATIEDQGRGCLYVTVTGNMIYRSGRATQRKLDDSDSSQIRVEASRGIVVTGNTLTAGRDDNMDPKGTSPKYGIVLGNLKNSVISYNAMRGAECRPCVRGIHGSKLPPAT